MPKTTQSLLNIVSSINHGYEKIAEITGENYNIFTILNLTTTEVRTHSAFIGDLLDIKGSHGQKEVFLKLFCDQMHIEDFNYLESKTKVEKNIGRISDDCANGGNIDIIVTDNANKAIIIENKIYAPDQKNQLFRYYNYGKEKCETSNLFYLTLDGKDASDSSKNELDETQFRKISYKVHIIKWLESCKEKAVNHPILRETITQYINLIKKLTGQTMNEDMQQEVEDTIISSGNNITSAIAISNSIDNAKRKLLLSFALKLKKRVKELNMEIEIEMPEAFGTKWQGMCFSLPNIEREYLKLSFLADMKDFYLEMFNEENGNGTHKNSLNLSYYKEKLEKIGNNCGKVENVNKAWWGDWVCRYSKLDNIFVENTTWGNIADNNDSDIIDQVANVIIELVKALKEKPIFTNQESIIA